MTIREIRALTKLSQAKFCEKYGIPLQTLQKWEQGCRNPTPYEMEWLDRIVREDFKMGKMVNMSTIDEMGKLKTALKCTQIQNIEDMLGRLSEEEKDCLLRLYVYEEDLISRRELLKEMNALYKNQRHLVPEEIWNLVENIPPHISDRQ